MTVKVGLLFEYKGSERPVVEAHVRVIEALDREQGRIFRARMDRIGPTGYVYKKNHEDSLRQVLRDASDVLDKLAPEGTYFGLPSTRSNLQGFWPNEWEGQGRSDAEARALGKHPLHVEIEPAPHWTS